MVIAASSLTCMASLFFFRACRVEAGIMRRMVLWDTACNFNGFISNQLIFNCLITGTSTLVNALLLLLVAAVVKRLSLFLIVACQLEHVSSYGFSTFMMAILTTVHIITISKILTKFSSFLVIFIP